MQGRCELAIAAATYALKLGTSMYGEGKLELVPAYLHLAEANLGLLQYRQARIVPLRKPKLLSLLLL